VSDSGVVIKEENSCALAFPYEERDGDGLPYYDHKGLTKREYFAAMAMQGLVQNDVLSSDYQSAAREAVCWADLLIDELSKRTADSNTGGESELELNSKDEK